MPRMTSLKRNAQVEPFAPAPSAGLIGMLASPMPNPLEEAGHHPAEDGKDAASTSRHRHSAGVTASSAGRCRATSNRMRNGGAHIHVC